MPEADEYDAAALDKYLSSQVMLSLGDTKHLAMVVDRKRDHHGNPIGVRKSDPKMDTSIYEVRFGDGTIMECGANIIAENLHSQVDPEGKWHLSLKEITDYHRDETAVRRKDLPAGKTPGDTTKCRTTRGWKLSVLWSDGTYSWVPLKDLKEVETI